MSAGQLDIQGQSISTLPVDVLLSDCFFALVTIRIRELCPVPKYLDEAPADECVFGVRYSQNLIKGYISRERATVVLSKAGTAFPGTGV